MGIKLSCLCLKYYRNQNTDYYDYLRIKSTHCYGFVNDAKVIFFCFLEKREPLTSLLKMNFDKSVIKIEFIITGSVCILFRKASKWLCSSR